MWSGDTLEYMPFWFMYSDPPYEYFEITRGVRRDQLQDLLRLFPERARNYERVTEVPAPMPAMHRVA